MALALRAFEYWLASYRRVWRGTIVSTVLNPVLYLTAIGVGLGKLVNGGSSPLGVPYVDYVAPGMLAATAMQVATQECSYPVMDAIRWTRQYHAMLATPLGGRDVLLGHQLWVAARVCTASAVYLVVLAAFGTVHSPLGVLTVPVAVLTGLAFSAPIAAFAATVETDAPFASLFRFAITPMFLFSGTFFPVTRLPDALRLVAYATPLWHGVDLCRHLTLGTAALRPSLLHVAYLATFAAAGLALARRAYRRRLER